MSLALNIFILFVTGRYPLAATRRRGYRGQRSVSMDDASPSDSEHEKWEREAHQENIWHGQGQKSGLGKYITNISALNSYKQA